MIPLFDSCVHCCANLKSDFTLRTTKSNLKMPIKISYEGNKAPRPSFFVVRPIGGSIVPLIAVDELPPSYDILNVPRSLDLEATIGMLNLGLQRHTGSHYTLIPKPIDSAKAEVSPSQQASPVKFPSHTEPKKAASLTSSSGSSSPILGGRSSSLTTLSALKQLQVITPTNSRFLADTVYCRHWCMYGKCKWGDRCRYRHEIPMSLPELKEVGLSDWPLWFKQLNPGFFATLARGCVNDCEEGRGHGHTHGLGKIFGYGQGRPMGGSAGTRGVRAAKGRTRRLSREEEGARVMANLRVREVAIEQAKILAEKKQAEANSAAVERALLEETKSWEEESEGAEKEVIKEEKGKGVKKEKLVDV